MATTTSKVIHLHDKAFRSAMSDLRVAKDFLNHYLPPTVLNKIDLQTLVLRKESYVDEEFKLLITDVLYSVTLKNSLKNDSAFVYVLCEHLSRSDPLAPWRMMRYVCRIVDQHLKTNKQTQLPLVIPLVVYNGRKVYPHSNRIYDLFSVTEKELAQQYMFQGFELIDFNKISDEEMRGHQWSCIMEILLKHAFSRDIMSYLENLASQFSNLAQRNGDDYLLGMLKYVVESTAIKDERRFDRFLQQSLPKPLEQAAMTLAQLWEKRGYQEGMQQGVQQGEYNLLLRQLERKFKNIPNHYRKRLLQADKETLLHWADRVLDANSLTEIFEESD